jgi:hypothetical protein
MADWCAVSGTQIFDDLLFDAAVTSETNPDNLRQALERYSGRPSECEF